MADKEAQPSTSMTRKRTRGTRLETYLMNKHIVPAVCYRAERSLLLEEKLANTTGLAEWMWHLLKTNRCVVISFQATLLGLGTRYFLIFQFLYSHLDFLHSDLCHFLMYALFSRSSCKPVTVKFANLGSTRHSLAIKIKSHVLHVFLLISMEHAEIGYIPCTSKYNFVHY